MKNLFKKTLPFAFLCLLISSVQAVDLQTKIPKNALYVFTINGQNFLTKMPLAELDKLMVMNDLCKELSKKNGSSETKLSNIGVNIGSTSYFFVEMTDSIIYFTYLFPISDLKKFETAFVGKEKTTKDANGNTTLSNNSSSIISWNKEYGMIIGSEVMSEYFTRYPEAYDRYNTGKKDGDKKDKKGKKERDVVRPEGEVDTVAVYEEDYAYDNNYYDDWSDKFEQRKEIAKIWMQKKASEIYNLKPAAAITANEKFVKSQDKTADAVSWMGSSNGTLNNLLTNFYQNTYRYSYSSKTKMPTVDANSPLFSDQNYMSATLRFNNKNIKMDITTGMDSRLMADYTKIATMNKLNKKFFNYLPAENLLGYYSIAISTQAALEGMPKIMTPYLQMMPYTNDIGAEIMDIYALFIDEQALGKLVKGDGIFAVTDLREKEVPYTTYEYDSLYNYTEVVGTRKEVVPEFVVMFSTEDAVTMDKIFSIAYKKGGLVKIADNYYETPKIKSMPFTISIIQKDGIVFVCNSKEQVDIIMKGKVKTPVSAENMTAMSTSTASMFVDLKKILNAIPDDSKNKSKDDEDYVSKSTKMLNYSRKNVGQIRMTQSAPVGNEIRSEMIITLPEGKENSAKYFVEFINELYMISEKGDKY